MTEKMPDWVPQPTVEEMRAMPNAPTHVIWFDAERLRFRRFHRAWARLLGYFWGECPTCGQMFGGHEWGQRDGKVASVPNPAGGRWSSKCICPACTRMGRGHRGDWRSMESP